MPLTIFSLNCRGLNKPFKRKLIFSQCKKYDISCLQETYITYENYKQWSNEWSGSIHYVEGTSNSNGLMILTNNKSYSVAVPKVVYSEKRILGIEFEISDKKYLVVNIYAPNKKKEKIRFYNNLYQLMNVDSEKDYDTVIICGDFNSVIDNHLDIISGAPHDTAEVNNFQTFMTNLDLYDTWRMFNPLIKDFTWHRKNPFTARRLDYILCNNLTLPHVINVEHEYMSCSDHKAIVLKLKCEQFKRGPGIWKFNNSLLNDRTFIDYINNLIGTFIVENSHKDASLKWELLKNEIKSKTIQYCNVKNQNTVSESKLLFKEINRINDLISGNPESQKLQESLQLLQQKYDILMIHKARGAQIRSRVKYIEDGERNTKYFLGIEKTRGSQNTIQQLKRNNTTINNPQIILDEIKHFYTDLYSKDKDVVDDIEAFESFLSDVHIPKLSVGEASSCESEISIKDISDALNQLNNDSAPGSDGLSVPFYKVFWVKLQHPLLESLISSLNKGELSVSQKRGIITLIHKGSNLDSNNLSNWRPITLLNTDYKIFSKVIAIRLQPIIDSLININQKGFIKGRNISDLIRLIDDSILTARLHKLPGLMVSVDFCKAFDSVSKSSIMNALNIFNFGPTFSKLVSVLINKSESNVRNGGWYSSFFPCEKGIRQGCCASPYLFLLVAELLSLKLRNSNKISGIYCARKNIQLNTVLQYADDTSLLLKDEHELESSLEIIEEFGTLSGLKLNRHKSVVLPIGGYVRNEIDLNNVRWLKPNDHIKVLGIYFSAEMEASNIDLNWKTKLQNMHSTINNWKKRKISLYGKVILCKTFILSKINYMLQSLSLPDSVLAEIDRIMFKFIWENQTSNKKVIEKISRSTLCQDFPDGGLKMISVKDQQKVSHVNWIKKVKTGKVNINIINALTEKVGGIEYVSKCRLENPYFILNNLIDSEFWKRVTYTWTNLLFEQKMSTLSSDDILQQPIFFNSEIRYHKNPLHFPYWIKNNILYLRDIFSNGKLMEFKDLSNKLNRQPGLIFDYNALRNAIPYNWKLNLRSTDDVLNVSNQTRFVNCIIAMNNFDIRKLIMSQKSIKKCNEKFWMRKLNFSVSNHYDIAIKSTKESRLRLLHFKIMHNIYPSNILLHKMKVRPNLLCDHCNEIDFIEHFFVECDIIKNFWKFVSSHINASINVQIKLTRKDILLGLPYSEFSNINKKDIDYINTIVLIGKLCISKLRYGKLKNIFLIFELELNLRKKVK